MKPQEWTNKQAKSQSKKRGKFVSRERERSVFNFSRSLRVAFRLLFAFGKKGAAFALAMAMLLIQAQAFIAFEAFVVYASATVVQVSKPIISPPGGQYEGSVDIAIYDSDPDATHIFYTITPGTDPDIAPDPICGIFPGGPKPIPLTITEDSVVKAIACDGASVDSHSSVITTEIYDPSHKGKIEGRKYNDMDKSGTLTAGDFPIEGWRVDLKNGTSVIATTVTASGGYYAFNDLNPANYTVDEEDRDGWQHMSADNVDVTMSATETHTVNFFNFDNGFACTPQIVNFPKNLAVQAAGSSDVSVNDDADIANGVTINGNVRSNDEIEKIGADGTRTINGNASTTNTIDSEVDVTGVTSTGTPAVALPDVAIPTWKAHAQSGGTVNGSFIFPANTVGLVMGPTEILGDLAFGNSNSVTVKGPIYVHGNLSIGSNSAIIQDSGFGNQFATIIVDGVISIDSNVTFSGSGSTGAFLLVSTHAAVSGTDAAIQTASSNSDVGDVVLYASNGDVHINQDRALLAVFAAHGTGVDADDNGAVRIDQNVTVNYRALPTTISCGAPQPYELTSHVLINEFMPNPIGLDDGAAGGALDGEWAEIFNPSSSTVDLAGYVLYDSINTHALPITVSNTNTGGTTIPSLGYLVVYREGDSDFALNNNGGDTVRLFSDTIGAGGVLVDSHLYASDAPEDKSFARVPDGASNWVDPDATPGKANNIFFKILAGKSDAFDPPDNPQLVIESAHENVPLASEPESLADSAVETTGNTSSTATATTTTIIYAGGGGGGGGGGGVSVVDSGLENFSSTVPVAPDENSTSTLADATSTTPQSDTDITTDADSSTPTSTDSGTGQDTLESVTTSTTTGTADNTATSTSDISEIGATDDTNTTSTAASSDQGLTTGSDTSATSTDATSTTSSTTSTTTQSDTDSTPQSDTSDTDATTSSSTNSGAVQGTLPEDTTAPSDTSTDTSDSTGTSDATTSADSTSSASSDPVPAATLP